MRMVQPRKSLRAGVAALITFAATLVGVAQQPTGVHPISGRRIAPVVGFGDAAWLDRPERELQEATEKALDALGITKGSTVADVGAGSGYFTIRLAARVGPTGRVFANDIQPEMLKLLSGRLAEQGITNVSVVLGTADDPKLPPSTFDLVLMVDVYHELSEPQKMLRHLYAALKPGGRLVLIEPRKGEEDPAFGLDLLDAAINLIRSSRTVTEAISRLRVDLGLTEAQAEAVLSIQLFRLTGLQHQNFAHSISVAEAKMEVEAEGYRLSSLDGSLPLQHLLIFTKP